MEWYGLTRSELKGFKENSGMGFMRKQIKVVEKTPVAKEFDTKDLKKYMKFVFVIKRNLELFLTEMEDTTIAFQMIISPFIWQAREMVRKMPEEFHDYASWYTEQQLRLSSWMQRASLDALVTEYLPQKN